MITFTTSSSDALEGRHELLLELFGYYSDWALEEVTVVNTGRYWIKVIPHHQTFWDIFERRFDPDFRLAKKYRANIRNTAGVGPYCPEFQSVRDLLNWLYECTGNAGFLWILLL